MLLGLYSEGLIDWFFFLLGEFVLDYKLLFEIELGELIINEVM